MQCEIRCGALSALPCPALTRCDVMQCSALRCKGFRCLMRRCPQTHATESVRLSGAQDCRYHSKWADSARWQVTTAMNQNLRTEFGGCRSQSMKSLDEEFCSVDRSTLRVPIVTGGNVLSCPALPCDRFRTARRRNNLLPHQPSCSQATTPGATTAAMQYGWAVDFPIYTL
jgi:hypothetical protein